MLFNTVFTLATTFVAVQGAAIKRQDTKTIWSSSTGGNTIISTGDGTVNWGSATPWSVLDTLGAHCSGTSCDESWEYDVEDGYVIKGLAANGKITVTVSTATYQEWSRNGIIEIIKSASAQAHTVNQTSYDSNACYTTACEGIAQTYKTIDQYWAPSRYAIRVENKDGSVISALTVNIAINVVDEVAGACDLLSGITGAGAALAGAVDAWLGAAFSLASIACVI